MSCSNRTSSAALSAADIVARSKNADGAGLSSPCERPGSATRPLAKKITLHNELPYFLMQGCHLSFVGCFSSCRLFVAKQRRHTVLNRFLPRMDLARVHTVPARQLPHRALPPDRPPRPLSPSLPAL